jgi:hypothetical protein
MIQLLVDATFLQRYFQPPFMVGSTLPNSLKPVNQTAECELLQLQSVFVNLKDAEAFLNLPVLC